MFVCTIDPVVQPQIRWLHGNGEVLASIPIGYDDESGDVTSAFVVLAPLPGYGDGSLLELVFRIVVTSADGTHIREYYDGLQTKPFIPDKLQRSLIQGALWLAVLGIIDGLRPPAVQMVTHTANLPEPALQKFNLIAALFAQRGYQIARPDPYHGRYTWMMRLP